MSPLRRTSVPCLLASLLLTIAGAAAASETSLRMTSEPGDWVGQGRTYYFTPGDGSFASYPYASYNAAWIVFLKGPTWPPRWDLFLAAPNGLPLTVGSYLNAMRFPFSESAGLPGLDVGGESRGCNIVVGSFEVLQVSYAADGSVTKLWATFEQRCEWATRPALRGEIRFNADVPEAIPVLSTTGLATLAISLLAGGALMLVRRLQ